MATTYTLINSTTVGSGGSSSVTFSSIPSTYTDLVIKASARELTGATANANIGVQFNGSATGLTLKELYGTGTAAGSAGISEMRMGYISGAAATTSSFGSSELYIPNYASANYKSSSGESVSEGNNAGQFMSMEANLWSNTAAITSVTLLCVNSFAQYSTFYLYGISNT